VTGLVQQGGENDQMLKRLFIEKVDLRYKMGGKYQEASSSREFRMRNSSVGAGGSSKAEDVTGYAYGRLNGGIVVFSSPLNELGRRES